MDCLFIYIVAIMWQSPEELACGDRRYDSFFVVGAARKSGCSLENLLNKTVRKSAIARQIRRKCS